MVGIIRKSTLVLETQANSTKSFFFGIFSVQASSSQISNLSWGGKGRKEGLWLQCNAMQWDGMEWDERFNYFFLDFLNDDDHDYDYSHANDHNHDDDHGDDDDDDCSYPPT